MSDEKIVKPAQHLEELLTAVQRQWVKFMAEDEHIPWDERRKNIALLGANFSAAWYLRALIVAAPELAAERSQWLREIFNGGGDIGEWTWDLLSEMGIDPATIGAAA